MRRVTQPDQSPFPSDGTPPTQSAYQQPPFPTPPPGVYGYGDPYNPYGAPVQQRNGLGTAGMVLGILALVLCWTTWPGIILGILAIIFSALGRGRAKRGEASNRGQATAGLVCGIIGTVLSIVVIIFVLAVLDKAKSCLDQYPDGGPQYTQCIQDSISGNN